ncbi:MAG: ThuA domain-containing protein [Treponema sp.]|jgi:trehalose utilization protein|nr:ThuA domain-containing protein [Treponema sp.]
MDTKNPIRVTVWNEYLDDQKRGDIAAVYPEGLHKTIAGFLNQAGGIEAGVSLIGDPEQGLSGKILDATDVLIWWGHVHHHEVKDEAAARVVDQVRRGMGIIFLHSAHRAKPFTALLGTSGRISWREAEERCRVWTADPSHPIAAGVPDQFLIDREEMYSEPFGIPEPESTVFISWFQGGNVLRSGVTFRREYGKIFYFQPGHETYPNYYHETVQRIIVNAVRWAAPLVRVADRECPQDKEPLERIGV